MGRLTWPAGGPSDGGGHIQAETARLYVDLRPTFCAEHNWCANEAKELNFETHPHVLIQEAQDKLSLSEGSVNHLSPESFPANDFRQGGGYSQ